jgi:hypothetical protein
MDFLCRRISKRDHGHSTVMGYILLYPVSKRKFRTYYEKKQAVVTTFVYAINKLSEANDLMVELTGG